MKFHELVQENRELGKLLITPKHKIKVLSNVTVNPIKDLLEYYLRIYDVNAEVSIGNYDNVLQDSENCSDYKIVLIILELRNYFNGFGFAAESMTLSQISTIVQSIKNQIDLTLDNLANVSMVFCTQLSTASYNYPVDSSYKIDEIVSDINDHMQNGHPERENVKIINVDKIVSRIGASGAYDMRLFYTSRAPYTLSYLEEFVLSITPSVLSNLGFAKKVLVLDCDNTLWDGVLGEDGADGIKMSYETSAGSIFSDIQSFVCGLASKGVIVCLCSKNNPEDVQNIIENHPDMKIRENIIAVKKINWNDKAENLKEIAKELNVGLESIVFLDDSDFEVNLVRNQLPMVTVLQVPKILHEYPSYFLKNSKLFFNQSTTDEDLSKATIYKDQSKRNAEKERFTNIEDYLESLEMEVIFRENSEEFVGRIAQLTNKTNQFNLTTIRYSEGDIRRFISDPDITILSANVADKFGDQGLVGLVILRRNGNELTIDTFLMSCRVIGRNIEFVIMDEIINLCMRFGAEDIYASFIPTLKNQQVSEFYSTCGFKIIDEDNGIKQYKLPVSNYKLNKIKYVRVK